MTTEPKWTKGPMTVSITDAWPFRIITSDANGKTVFQDDLPCHTTSDKTASDAISGRGFPAHEREKVREMNERAVADAYIRASADDLYWALEDALLAINGAFPSIEAHEEFLTKAEEKAVAALAKARGESND